MSDGVKINVKGMRQFREALDKIGREATAAARREVQTAAINIQTEAKRKAPVHLGRLRSSIAWRLTGETEAVVGTNVEYAKFVEFGTGPAGRQSHFSQLAQQAMRDIGYVHGPRGGFPPIDEIEDWAVKHGFPPGSGFMIALSIRKKGTPAQPFLIPAIEGERRDFERRLTDALRRAVDRASR